MDDWLEHEEGKSNYEKQQIQNELQHFKTQWKNHGKEIRAKAMKEASEFKKKKPSFEDDKELVSQVESLFSANPSET